MDSFIRHYLLQPFLFPEGLTYRYVLAEDWLFHPFSSPEPLLEPVQFVRVFECTCICLSHLGLKACEYLLAVAAAC